MKAAKLVCTLAVGCLTPTAALAASQCPALTGADPTYVSAGGGCNDLITINSGGSVSITAVNPNPYEGSEDQYIGVQNNGTTALSSLTLSGPPDLFFFEGDGITAYGIPGNSQDTGGYGGPNAFFTNISSDFSSGTVNFITPIVAGGGTGYFSLELSPAQGSFTVTGVGGGGGVTPEPNSLILLGTGAAGLAATLRRRLFALASK